MKTLFDHNVRVLLCDNCGAPLEAALAAPVARCRHCSAENRVGVRNEGFVVPRQQVSEQERMGRLRMQDGRPLVAPPALVHLIENNDIAPWRVAEAVAIWQSTRKELRAAPSNPEAAERLLFLTLALSNQFATSQDFLKARAMYESALEAFTLPRHRQMMHGFLSRLAAREGDLDSAEAWLKPCDAAPDDLESDTAHRLSRALIEAGRGRPGGVLTWLGQTHEAVPIQDAFDALGVLLRADAVERLGNPAAAAELLKAAMFHRSDMRVTLEAVRGTYTRFGFCQQSFAMAMSSHGARVAEQGAARAGGGAGVMILVIGGGSMLFAAVIFFVTMQSVPSFPGMGSTFGFSGLSILLPFVIIVPIALKLIRGGQKTRRILQFGVPGTARVLAVQPTGTIINGVPQLEVQLMVQLPDRPPYPANTRLLLDPVSANRLASSGSVRVKVDPESPADVALEM